MIFSDRKTIRTGLSVAISVLFVLFWAISGNVALANEIDSADVIELLNRDRAKEGLEQLRTDPVLDRAAQRKARDMVTDHYFAHTSPAGVTPWYWIETSGYDYRLAGENLAMSFNDARKQQQAWMDSPTHRRNIMNPGYRDVGVAVEKGFVEGRFTTVVVQMFGSRSESPVFLEAEILPADPDPVVLGIEQETYGMPVVDGYSMEGFYENGWALAALVGASVMLLDAVRLLRKYARTSAHALHG